MNKLRKRRSIICNNLLFPIILLVLLFLGIGFAYIESYLQVNGDFIIANNSWDIHFEKAYVLSNDIVEIAEPTITDFTKISFNINFESGDAFYEVYAFVKNDGVVDAHVSEIKYGIPENIMPYVKFEVTYGDNKNINVNDLLKAGDYEQIKISLKLVENFSDIWMKLHPEIGTSLEEEDIIADFSAEFTFEIKYVQDFGEGISKKKSTLIQSLGLDKNAITEEPSFVTAPDASTSGLYVVSDTLNDTYPVYYYRGIVSDNNVLFADLCWKIVRTTDKGGVKLIYNGKPNSSKQCSNTGTATQITTAFLFNSTNDSLADVGYMYGNRYVIDTFSTNTNYIYGNDVFYDSETKMYTLLDTNLTSAVAVQSDEMVRHYTCKSSTINVCSTVYYVYTYYSSTAYAYALNKVKNIDEAKEKMFENINNSKVLDVLNEWYEANILNNGYSGFIDDSIWCNDRTIVSGGLYSKDNPLISNVGAYFSSYTLDNDGRGLYDAIPKPAFHEKDSCPNENDQFTTKYAIDGNNKLKYSIGLLTADEVTLVGSGYKSYNTSSYLRTGQNLWTMTPSYYGVNIAYNFYFSNFITPASVKSSYYLRPSIVLRAYSNVVAGDGTSTNPYRIG